MLCPQCRRMVGKDGYCPMGHLARPELQMQPPKAAPPPMTAAPPQAAPTPTPEAPREAPDVEVGPPAAPGGFAPVTLPTGIPGGPPPVPADQLFAVGKGRGRSPKVIAFALVLLVGSVLAVTLLGKSAGASNLRLVFTPGETRTYSFEVTMRGQSGNLEVGGFAADIAIDADLTQRTGALRKDGSATITYTIRNLHYSTGGRRVSAPPGTGGSYSVLMRPNGETESLDGGDPFGLEHVNPAANFVSPENLVPLLPNHKIVPGQSWTLDDSGTDPNLGRLSVHVTNTLVEQRVVNGNKAAVIRTQIEIPLDIHLGHDQLVKGAGASADSIPRSATFSMIGPMTINATQTIYTSNGALESALGDGKMTGTMTIGGIPNLGSVSIVYNLTYSMTMLLRSTGQSA